MQERNFRDNEYEFRVIVEPRIVNGDLLKGHSMVSIGRSNETIVKLWERFLIPDNIVPVFINLLDSVGEKNVPKRV